MALRSASSARGDEPVQDLDESSSLNVGARGPEDPARPDKRRIAAITALVLLIALSLPWWLSNKPLRPATEWLNGWTLLITGFSIPPFDIGTGFNPLGRALLGLLPVVPVLVLTVLLILRAARPAWVRAGALFIWAVFALLGLSWLLLLGALQTDSYNGANPVMLGVLLTVMATVFTAIAAANWWRLGERRAPSRRTRRTPAIAGEVSDQAGEDFVEKLTIDDESDSEAGVGRVRGSAPEADETAVTGRTPVTDDAPPSRTPDEADAPDGSGDSRADDSPDDRTR